MRQGPTGNFGIHPALKIWAGITQLAYGAYLVPVPEAFSMGTTADNTLKKFCDDIISKFEKR